MGSSGGSGGSDMAGNQGRNSTREKVDRSIQDNVQGRNDQPPGFNDGKGGGGDDPNVDNADAQRDFHDSRNPMFN